MKPTILLLIMCLTLSTARSQSALTFEVSLPSTVGDTALDGRLILLISNNNEDEPRFQLSDGPDTQLGFGIDVEDWSAQRAAVFTDTVFGYPLRSIANIPPGDYHVQALLHVYETFNLANGHTVKLPMDQGEGQQWNRSPGNLYSTPKQVTIDPTSAQAISLTLDQKIPPIEAPKDTKYVKHVRIQSKLLSEFWGRPMYLGAHVLLPEGFDEHPEARYPLNIFHGHYPSDFDGFRTTPPDPNLKPEHSARFDLEGYNIIEQQEAYDFYKTWTGPDFPRMLIIEIQHPTPYYDDSYAVNSANQGPYGDAITHELIPYIEEQFRGIGEGWARFSTVVPPAAGRP